MRTLLVVAVALVGLSMASLPLDTFRNVFAAHCKRHNSSMTDDEIRRLVLYPTESLVKSEEVSTVEELDALYNKTLPSDCYKAGANMPFGDAGDVLAPLLQKYKTGEPVTIIFIPFMFADFVIPWTHSAAYRNDSAFALDWAAAVAKNPGATDKTWDMMAMDNIELPIDTIIKAGSVDMEDGTPLFNLVWLTTHEGSLESLNPINEVSPLLVRRITKFLDMIGDKVKDFVFVGFSRGTLDALEIASQAPNLPWGKRLRGVISLDGVVWGTTLCDCALHQSPGQSCESFSEIFDVIGYLSTALVPKKTHFAGNLVVLEKALQRFNAAAAKYPLPEQMDGTKIVFPDLTRTWIEILRPMIFSMWDIWHPIADYDNNIKRTMMLNAALVASMKIMSTKERLAWFANHTIPEDLLLMGVTSTMTDKSYSTKGVYLHPDEFINRELYYLMNSADQQEMIDCAVPTSREKFISNMHTSLNKDQKPYKNQQWLALFNISHVGIGVEYEVPTPDHWVFPFPRMALLDSLATWVAMNL